MLAEQSHLVNGDARRGGYLCEGRLLDLLRHRGDKFPRQRFQGGGHIALFIVAILGSFGMTNALGPIVKRLVWDSQLASRALHIAAICRQSCQRICSFLVAVSFHACHLARSRLARQSCSSPHDARRACKTLFAPKDRPSVEQSAMVCSVMFDQDPFRKEGALPGAVRLAFEKNLRPNRHEL